MSRDPRGIPMVHPLLYVGFGGFIGAILRFLVSGWIQNGSSGFPLGTMTVNFLGSLTLSSIMYLSDRSPLLTPETKLLVTVGFLGAFTTMSTFSFETYRLLENGETIQFITYLLGTNLSCLIGVYLGKILSTLV